MCTVCIFSSTFEGIYLYIVDSLKIEDEESVMVEIVLNHVIADLRYCICQHIKGLRIYYNYPLPFVEAVTGLRTAR